MIKIDDAGWGCLVGGVLIGAAREGTKEFHFGEVVPEAFQGAEFDNKVYLHDAGVMVLDLLDKLSAPADEGILLCTGYCLDGVAETLSANGYAFNRGKITGHMQDRIEHELQKYLGGFGFNVDYDILTNPTKKGLFWWKQVNFLKGGDVNSRAYNKARAENCKTGWKSFSKWANLPYQEAKKGGK